MTCLICRLRLVSEEFLQCAESDRENVPDTKRERELDVKLRGLPEKIRFDREILLAGQRKVLDLGENREQNIQRSTRRAVGNGSRCRVPRGDLDLDTCHVDA